MRDCHWWLLVGDENSENFRKQNCTNVMVLAHYWSFEHPTQNIINNGWKNPFITYIYCFVIVQFLDEGYILSTHHKPHFAID